MKSNSGRLNGDSSCPLGWEKIGDGRAIIDVTYSTCVSAVIEHTLRGGCLARIDVGDDSNVPRFFGRRLAIFM